MKAVSIITFAFAALFFISCGDRSAPKNRAADSPGNPVKTSAQPGFNKTLADSLGADEYGMKKYVFVILKTGETKPDDKTKRDSIFTGHMKNIKRLVDEGKLVLAGPMEENEKKYEGIFILNVKTIAEGKALLDTDPAVHAGLLSPELYEWYGSAALPMYLPYHDAVQKEHF